MYSVRTAFNNPLKKCSTGAVWRNVAFLTFATDPEMMTTADILTDFEIDSVLQNSEEKFRFYG
jgi:hypothetical protein